VPCPRVRDTRAALVEHFKEERFVHQSALFAPDDAKLAEWLAKNREHGGEDGEAPADGPVGGSEDDGNAADAEHEELDEADADASANGLETAYGIAAE
ncbi:plasmid partitioning protein, partial [Rhizobium sp. NZLR1]|nr:plasmid partitioning protein [Rhizobium sp. NZLR4b]MBX5190788.1 plasmid partitioning protein [Rhizobium sp. NZLR3b]MBX5204403.1 plasmid partitioning protein [Rhizobium sp. NZLR1]